MKDIPNATNLWLVVQPKDRSHNKKLPVKSPVSIVTV
jgi:hypothetical protein